MGSELDKYLGGKFAKSSPCRNEGIDIDDFFRLTQGDMNQSYHPVSTYSPWTGSWEDLRKTLIHEGVLLIGGERGIRTPDTR